MHGGDAHAQGGCLRLSLPFGMMLLSRSRSKFTRTPLRIRSHTFSFPQNPFLLAANISSDAFVRRNAERSPAIWCAPLVIGASVRNDEDLRSSSLDLWPTPTLRSHKNVWCDRWLFSECRAV